MTSQTASLVRELAQDRVGFPQLTITRPNRIYGAVCKNTFLAGFDERRRLRRSNT